MLRLRELLGVAFEALLRRLLEAELPVVRLACQPFELALLTDGVKLLLRPALPELTELVTDVGE